MKLHLFIGSLCACVIGVAGFKFFNHSPIPPTQAQVTECTPEDTQNYCQAGRTPDKTNYYPADLGTSVTNPWTINFAPDKIFPQAQTIIYQNKAIVGTEAGHVYAFSTATGSQTWHQTLPRSILASVAAYNQKIYVPNLDGSVYILDAATGNQQGRIELNPYLGLSASPLLIPDKNLVVIGGRDGWLYFIHTATDQKLAIKYNAQAPIIQSPAYHAASNRVIFGTIDNRVHFVNADTGAGIRSGQLYGSGFKDWYPVATSNQVIIRTFGNGKVDDPNACTSPAACQKSLYVFDPFTGQELRAVQHSNSPMMHGSAGPPCLLPNGRLFTAYGNTGVTTAFWGELDLSTGLMSPFRSGPEDGVGNMDENVVPSCSKNLAIIFHTAETTRNAGAEDGVALTGYWHLTQQAWFTINPAHAATANRMHRWHNTQGAGGSPASIANGQVFHLMVGMELNARNFR